MKATFKNISVFFDKDHNLIGVSFNKKMVEQKKVTSFSLTGDEGALVEFLLETLGNCTRFLPRLFSSNKGSVLEEYLGVNSWNKAVVGRGCVFVRWVKDRGYRISPTLKNPKMKNAFTEIRESVIDLPEHVSSAELAEAFLKAMAISEEHGI